MKIPQNIIDQVIEQTDIVELVSQHVTLKKFGSNFKGLCPFHQEKTPSFVVSMDKQIYHCFGCGVGGNAIGFVMNLEKLNFPETIQKLADRLNIAVPKEDRADQKDDFKALYFKVNAYANWFFGDHLTRAPIAQEYFTQRGLSAEIQKTFELGFAPDTFEELLNFLKSKNVPLEKAQDLGLVKSKTQGSYYDFFRGRLMFPIHNVQGKVIGFGGRVLGSNSEAKYINSPESPIYNKSFELYGLYQAKKTIINLKQVVIVEGYIDVLSCVQLGISNAVAPLGTSLTLSQVKSLVKFTPEIILMFDGDNAGKKAAIKGFETCLSAGFHPKVVILPEGQDPGDYLTKTDESLPQKVSQAVYAMDWMFTESIKKATSDVTTRAKIIKYLASWIKRLPDSLERIGYKNKLTQFFEISAFDVDKIIENTFEFAKADQLESSLSLEALLVYLYIKRPTDFPESRLSLIGEEFDDLRLKKIAEVIELYFQKHETFAGEHTIRQLMMEMPADLQGVFSQILLFEQQMTSDSNMTGDYNIGECVQKFKRQRNKKRLRELTAQILAAEGANDLSMKTELLKQKQKLLEQI